MTISNTRCALRKIAKNLSSCSICANLLELHDNPFWKARVEAFNGWYKCHWKDQWTRESKDSKQKLSHGSAKRAQSVPVTRAERRTNPVETPRPWRDIGVARTDPEFLHPETPESQSPVSKKTRELWKKPKSICSGSQLESQTLTRRTKGRTVPTATSRTTQNGGATTFRSTRMRRRSTHAHGA